MDKKQKLKPVLAVCFVVLCGAGYVGIRYMGQEKGQIVFEKVPETGKVSPKAERVTEKASQTTGEGTEAGGELSEKFSMEKNVCVHVCGAVVAEGVYSLPAGSRVADGVTAAGGFSESADTTYHNLAALLSDGQKVYVPTVEETRELSVSEKAVSSNGEPGGRPLSGENGTGKVNINTADAEELMTLSGIGEAKANSILQYREKVGPFQSIEELKNVSGIGDAMFERVRDSIIVK